MIRVIKSSTVILAGHVAFVGRRKMQRFSVGKPKKRDHLEDLRLDGKHNITDDLIKM
jgi:hypothetical protein